MSWTAWIIVKAHSERVPGKNFAPFAGQPLVRWILDTLAAVPAVERVVINTDAADALRAAGVLPGPRLVLRERPLDLRGSRVDANTLLRRDLDDGVLDGRLLLTHATNPLLRPPTIRAALEACGQGTSLMAVTRHQARFFGPAGPVSHDPADLLPTQDLDPLDEENSCLYLVHADTVRTHGNRLGPDPRRFPIPASEAVDIDGPEDWRHAELVARGRRGARPSAVLFDLDGTLIDSLPVVADALTRALPGAGPFTAEQTRPWLGEGVEHLLACALGVPDPPQDAIRAFQDAYLHAPPEATRPFPGVAELLDDLDQRGVPMAICTNKPRRTTEPTLEALGWTGRFGAVYCPEDVPRKKPAPDMLLRALHDLRAAASGAVYLGDSPGDGVAADRAGLAFACADWGYANPRPGDAVFADVPSFGRRIDELATWGRLLGP